MKYDQNEFINWKDELVIFFLYFILYEKKTIYFHLFYFILFEFVFFGLN